MFRFDFGAVFVWSDGEENKNENIPSNGESYSILF